MKTNRFLLYPVLSLLLFSVPPISAQSLVTEDATTTEVTIDADLWVKGNDDPSKAALEVEGDTVVKGDQQIDGDLQIDQKLEVDQEIIIGSPQSDRFIYRQNKAPAFQILTNWLSESFAAHSDFGNVQTFRVSFYARVVEGYVGPIKASYTTYYSGMPVFRVLGADTFTPNSTWKLYSFTLHRNTVNHPYYGLGQLRLSGSSSNLVLEVGKYDFEFKYKFSTYLYPSREKYDWKKPTSSAYRSVRLGEKYDTPGAIRFNKKDADFEGYDGTQWRSLTVGSGGGKGSVFSGGTIRGSGNWASGHYASSWGSRNSSSGDYATAWGYSNKATGRYATALGYRNTASGTYSTTWGRYNTASGLFSTTWGSGSKAMGSRATAWGSSTASGNNATAWGLGNLAESYLSTAFGRYNIGGYTIKDAEAQYANGDFIWFPTDPLLEIGAGDSSTVRANALTLLKDGRIALGKHDTLEDLQSREETVQVGGALLVGDYAEAPDTPTPGAVRYNSADADFEGYDGSAWNSFTESTSDEKHSALYDPEDSENAVVEVSTGAESVNVTADLHVSGNTTLAGTILLQAPQGDIPMGAFTAD